MITRHLLHDAGHCLRAATPPLLTLAVLTATRSVLLTSPTRSADDHFLPVWNVAVVTAALWLVAAVCWAGSRPSRDRRAFQRLQHLRDLATGPHRAIVHVKTVFWGSAAGQYANVVNVATGVLHRVWLPEMTIPIGAFVVLERTDSGVRIVEWVNGPGVLAAHRHQDGRGRSSAAADLRVASLASRQERAAAAQLIRETEEFLHTQ